MDLFISLIIHELVSHLPRGYWHTYFNIFLRFQLYMFISSQAWNNVTSPPRGNLHAQLHELSSLDQCWSLCSLGTGLPISEVSSNTENYRSTIFKLTRVPPGFANIIVAVVVCDLMPFRKWCTTKVSLSSATKSRVLSAWCTDWACYF